MSQTSLSKDIESCYRSFYFNYYTNLIFEYYSKGTFVTYLNLIFSSLGLRTNDCCPNYSDIPILRHSNLLVRMNFYDSKNSKFETTLFAVDV